MGKGILKKPLISLQESNERKYHFSDNFSNEEEIKEI